MPSAEKGREPPQTGGGSGGGSGFCPGPEWRGRIHDPTGEVLILPPGKFLPCSPVYSDKPDSKKIVRNFFIKNAGKCKAAFLFFYALLCSPPFRRFPGRPGRRNKIVPSENSRRSLRFPAALWFSPRFPKIPFYNQSPSPSPANDSMSKGPRRHRSGPKNPHRRIRGAGLKNNQKKS